MKEFKPPFHKGELIEDIVYGYIAEGCDDTFIDVKSLEFYRTSNGFWQKDCYKKLVRGFGKNVFVFDVESCGFFERGEK